MTESTGKVARCFYALSQKRADAKRYPAIDALASYSKYLTYDEFIVNAAEKIQEGWVENVSAIKRIIRSGLEAKEQIDILGDDAVPIDYHINFWKSEMIDFGFIQQDSFDKVDMNSPIERQRFMLNRLLELCGLDYQFEDYQLVSDHFKKMINLLRQMNYSEYDSDKFKAYDNELQQLAEKAILHTENT